MKLMISFDVTNYIQTTNSLHTKQCSVSHATSTWTRNGQSSAHKIHIFSKMGRTADNCQTHKAWFEQCPQHFYFKPRVLSFKPVMQRLTKNERWRAIGMLQNGNIQLNVPDSLTCQSLSSAHFGTASSRLETWSICPVLGVHVLLLLITCIFFNTLVS